MNVRRMAVLAALACGLAGCGPNNSAGGGDAAKLDGVWMISKVETTGDDKPPTNEELQKMVLSIKGNLITAKKQGEKETMYAKFEVDEKASPKVITFTVSDEKGEPKKGPGDKGEPITAKAIFSVDGDTAKLAICPAPDAPPPTDFTPKAPAKKFTDPDAKDAKISDFFGTQVIHFARQKDLPDWAK